MCQAYQVKLPLPGFPSHAIWVIVSIQVVLGCLDQYQAACKKTLQLQILAREHFLLISPLLALFPASPSAFKFSLHSHSLITFSIPFAAFVHCPLLFNMHFLQSAGALATFALSLTNAAPVTKTGTIDVTDKYIVTLKSGISLVNHMHYVQDIHARSIAKRQGPVTFGGVYRNYNNTNFKGYAGHFDKTVVEQLKANEEVDSVEPDQVWSTFALVGQDRSTYGLSMLSHQSTAQNNYVYDSSAGEGTFGYVVDTGINLQHQEFEGRAVNGFNALQVPFADTAGHGSHVAGTMCSRTYGVAKKCNLVAVKVFDGEQGTTSAILQGYSWAVRDIVSKGRQAKAVINMSLGGGYSSAFNTAVNQAYQNGVTTVVAAGNEGQDATYVSPASAEGAITVAAVDQRKVRANFSNFGRVVSVFAPGVNILSTWMGSSNAVNTISGTSMASPHVAGLALYLKGLMNLPDAQSTKNYIMQSAVQNVVQYPQGSQNLMAYNGSGQ
ncbi:subtilisin-like protease-like protein [Myriangium duriaei CBS 260.36]|uniref:Subtilisin-like protease-like protein n=1 Tax=Myriangium duriaei CBS 260.36 TaxID=1168546 RepID=A0A9P4JAC2_9PEZI|nr:subtilisin-like protease-like protein [Myriangium duriaei CBS 260.36]